MTDLIPEIAAPPPHTVNVPLLRKVLDHITAHLEEWDQSTWARVSDCGTAYCVAGWAVKMAGLDVDTGRRYAANHMAFLTDGREIEYAAAELLGVDPLPEDDASDHLFHPYNSLRTVWELAAELTNGEITVPDDLPA